MVEPRPRKERDAPLRYDIRMLGEMLGHAIRQHGGSRVFEMVERLRLDCRHTAQSSLGLFEDNAITAMLLTHVKTPVGSENECARFSCIAWCRGDADSRAGDRLRVFCGIGTTSTQQFGVKVLRKPQRRISIGVGENGDKFVPAIAAGKVR